MNKFTFNEKTIMKYTTIVSFGNYWIEMDILLQSMALLESVDGITDYAHLGDDSLEHMLEDLGLVSITDKGCKATEKLPVFHNYLSEEYEKYCFGKMN